ncbi:DUF1534 domain-containing protein, partial [Pseudomonas syringae]|nr:DUF1534 domain-containing protein [Pseudomonas syringae]MCF5299887.1 DUF1534 domain-containing protein [Pseudomonas syringae]MCF5332657.1 DUF1534 domain-containing protein [Pseudomonas syringae]MCF5408537.1 DUF1534 domain-containing protein [Pseudomonas syringae]MCF5413432.1 DUF1534 domain-containing protein [Pseudomonas syringae]
TCLAGTILFHGCEFCLLCIFTHDASKGCIQPSGVTPLQRGNALRDAPRHISAPHRTRSPECRQRIGMSEILA